MKKYNLNQVIETLAPVIAQKNDYRAVIDYTNGETLLLDFSSQGEPFLFQNMLAVWVLQQTLTDEAGKYAGTNELDYGAFCDTDYTEVFQFVLEMLNKADHKVKDFYYETF